LVQARFSLLAPVDYLREDMGDVLMIWKPRDFVGDDLYRCRRYEDGYVIVGVDCTVPDLRWCHAVASERFAMAISGLIAFEF